MGQYKSAVNLAEPEENNSMTIIHEEELEDSALISNFNSRLATTHALKNLSATHA